MTGFSWEYTIQCQCNIIGARKTIEKAIYFTFIYYNFYESFYLFSQTLSQSGYREQEWYKRLAKGNQPTDRLLYNYKS